MRLNVARGISLDIYKIYDGAGTETILGKVSDYPSHERLCQA